MVLNLGLFITDVSKVNVKAGVAKLIYNVGYYSYVR